MSCSQSKYAWQILISLFQGAALAQFPTYTSTAVVFCEGNKTKGRLLHCNNICLFICAQGYLGVTCSFLAEKNEFKWENTKNLSGGGLHHPGDFFSANQIQWS